ncbi:bifunctional UDP-N-acetylglucosamine diphosphorylase/glucosamine-1-phosphate N-acetyltransferase GlmU [Tateyamaria sp.]|uniref:bifunctional UDP-N-acetylglucosamine diphosphorylase/glucosamine-1-phosphate N-acetyltransferase GlmU n=1 Tax=Tateyamaria sp. TaxID=1929288 RepID=UPI003B21E230
MSVALIILAAGKGTRMNSDLPKVLHPIAGAPMLHHAMATGTVLDPAHVVVVAGFGADLVTASTNAFDPTARVVLQKEQLGTGHATAQAKDALKGFDGLAIVLFGDTPFLRPETLEAIAATTADVTVLGFEAADPGRYGRLVMEADQLARIVEFKDASEAERAITLCNSGVVAAPAPLMFDLIDALDNDNAQGEYYLTDLPRLARARDLSVTVVQCDEAETLGINSRAELAAADAQFQRSARIQMMEDGVTMMAPDSVYLSLDTIIGRDALIEPNVVFGPGVTVESGATIRAFSHLEGCHVSQGVIIGPYARLRPGTELAEDVRVGNFVEIKNATLAAGAKVNHLSYIGDASIGEASNIGAGTITCNYDGVMKHRTEIGARAFIGSNTMLVAPVSVGDEAMTGSGSVITSDVDAGALALARAPQVEKPGMARKLFEMLKAKKARQSRGS